MTDRQAPAVSASGELASRAFDSTQASFLTLQDPKNAKAADDAAVAQMASMYDDSDDEEEAHQAKWYHAAFHIVCAIVGTGVLGLPKAFAQLTWIPGCILLATAFVVTYYMAYIVSVLSTTLEGVRVKNYTEMCEAVIGKQKTRWLVLPFLYAGCVGVCIAYLIVAGESLNSVYTENCPTCTTLRQMVWTSCIAAVQLLLCLFPSLDDLKFVSLLGAVMSAGYSTIAVVMCFVMAPQPQLPPPSYGLAGSTTDSVFQFFMGITTIVFAFNFQLIAPDIQITLADKPSPQRAMMRAVNFAYVFVFAAYFLSAISGYYSFGNMVSSDVLVTLMTYAESSAEKGIITAAQIMVVIHVGVAYQVFAMVMYQVMEQGYTSVTGRKCPRLVNYIMRWVYVLLTWLVACAIPFFGDFMSLIGAASYVPLSFVIPCSLYLVRQKAAGVNMPVHTLAVIYCIIAATVLVGVVGVVASVRQIVIDATAGDFVLFA